MKETLHKTDCYIDYIDSAFKRLDFIEQIVESKEEEYGGLTQNAKMVQDFMDTNYPMIRTKEKQDIPVITYYVFMIGAKLARLHHNTRHEDSINDLIGYTLALRKYVTSDIRLKTTNYYEMAFIDRLNDLLETLKTQTTIKA